MTVTLRAGEMMVPANKLYTIKPPMTLEEVAELFVTHKISGAPIIDLGGRILSVMGEGALLRLAAKHGLSAMVLNCLGELPADKDLITLNRDATFPDIYRLFITHQIHRIPVVDSNGMLKGLISRSQILKMFVEAHYGRKLPKS